LPAAADAALIARGWVPSAHSPDRPPSEDELRPSDRWRRIVAVAEALAEGRLERERLALAVGYPPDAYDQFRRDVLLRPPPTMPTAPPTVLVDARAAAPSFIRATLRALQDQSLAGWRALVIAPDSVRDHPVGAFAVTDSRIQFVGSVTQSVGNGGPAVLIDAGTVLDPEALAWLGFALERTGAAAAFADHDHGIADPGLRLVRADPVLFGTFDRVLFDCAGPPAVVAIAGAFAAAAGLPLAGNATARREWLNAAGRERSVAGVPRVLATRLALPLVARAPQPSVEDAAPGWLAPIAYDAPPRRSPPPRDDRIAVVIPTRDSPALLARAIETLRATARLPGRLDIIVVDNRSVRDDTLVLFRQLAAEGVARTVPLDAPFNWSLASNTGAAASDAPLIAFVNDDVEMLAPRWDDVLVEALDDPEVGAVGARLIYPGRTVQHAGVAFGFGPGGAEHEGRGAPASERGPAGRYVTPHAVSSVTGAFLAVRRGDFDRVGGFDAERLMVAHSDFDFCLQLRELGLTIMYCPAIEALHHEGATRGINQTRAAIAWDEGERADLIDRWGDALFEDPGISPYWLRGNAPFELLREPSMREIVAHIDRSSRPDPWRPTRRIAQVIREW
jgi:GT2 family glycosyltransferase